MRFVVLDRDTTEQHDSNDYGAFTEHMLDADQLPIREWLPRLPTSSFFLVAATGLGKTVAVPLYLFSRACSNAKQGRPPTIYVVEPTIPICLNEEEHMNARFAKFMLGRKRSTYHPFGVITGAGKAHTAAPIRFITTGVFELLAKDPRPQPAECRFVIDEAHRVLERQPGAEIALGILRSRGFSWKTSIESPMTACAQPASVRTSPDLSSDQPVTWFAPNSRNTGYVYFDNGSGFKWETFTLTELTISVAAIPEPGTYSMFLFGFGTICMLARRQTRNLRTQLRLERYCS